MSIELFLLSMQAAGAVSDMIGSSAQVRAGRAGTALELATVETRLAEERLSSAMSAVDAMQALRQNLASQRAIMAARGQSGAAGTGLFAGVQSQVQHSSGEQVRRMNLLSREATLRAGGSLAAMHQASSESAIGQALSKRMFDQIPFTELKQLSDRKKVGTVT
jgi:hypothetical protein